ncbi:MAG: hypothetical protein H0U70_02140 [Tatlockia sp.]|nr:hypothetical protein [Tatlockia sp.]
MSLKQFFLLFIIFFTIQNSQAEETDQFTLPPFELLDLGPTVSLSLYDVLEEVLSQTNKEIQAIEPRAKHSRFAAKELALRLQGNYLVELFYRKTGPGFPRWLRGQWSHLLKQTMPFNYIEVKPWKTIYWLSLSPFPFHILMLAPTINLYGHYFGTDKLGHFFMIGHNYYKIYRKNRINGRSVAQAQAAMVSFGCLTEHSFLGTLSNGVYSNADLAANFAGWKFYRNLTHSIKIANQSLPPILLLQGHQWTFAKTINKNNLLKPFLLDHLNEALNPSHYTFSRSQIRREINSRCADWISRKGLKPEIVEAKLKETLLWQGEDYGHWLPTHSAITLNTCFGGY